MNKSVLITGAHGGTGMGIAKKFASEGYDVFLTSRNKNEAEEAAKELASKYDVNVVGYQLESGNEEKVKEVFADIKKRGYLLDVLVLNAANLGIGMDVFTVELADWMNVLEVNLGWNFTLARAAALHMREKKKGSIVFIGSNTSSRVIKNRSAYIASKGGIVSLARSLAIDLGPFGIRVNSVLPGMIRTERWHNSEELRKVPSNNTPIGDIAEYEDIANGVWYFGSDMSRNTTGTELVIDGGMTAQLCPGV